MSSCCAQIDGAAAGEYFGGALAAAGDVNGDGIGDIIIGAAGAVAAAGRAYILYGSVDLGLMPLNLSDLLAADGQRGFVIEGAVVGARAGAAVAAAGDVNGDGAGDVSNIAAQCPALKCACFEGCVIESIIYLLGQQNAAPCC